MKPPSSFATAIGCLAAAIAILVPAAARADIVNVARGATATSNRVVYGGWSMSWLVDGDFGSLVHSDANPGVGLAYTVDLGKDYSISQLKVWPRQDGCCPERLSNFRVAIHADNGAGQIGATLSITFSGGTLESSESLGSGSWSPLPGAVSPYPVVPGTSPRFYRVRP